ncbi:hypothetical protein O9G_003717 [Rozella allomycis CSF55]|uniref:Uncharacterized protein n=1 Tax=Rozella allomycis (strain CSF55) TaxID=988480 RepID=A0A075ART3_ROZAC|nr:hypothetical protein O9G_003717 [Rozella allomycis CSF55]|eukprot:EPZ32986.1 hypothetical protein O9G_003717 [Rozella allomycis CSF55]
MINYYLMSAACYNISPSFKLPAFQLDDCNSNLVTKKQDLFAYCIFEFENQDSFNFNTFTVNLNNNPLAFKDPMFWFGVFANKYGSDYHLNEGNVISYNSSSPATMWNGNSSMHNKIVFLLTQTASIEKWIPYLLSIEKSEAQLGLESWLIIKEIFNKLALTEYSKLVTLVKAIPFYSERLIRMIIDTKNEKLILAMLINHNPDYSSLLLSVLIKTKFRIPEKLLQEFENEYLKEKNCSPLPGQLLMAKKEEAKIGEFFSNSISQTHNLCLMGLRKTLIDYNIKHKYIRDEIFLNYLYLEGERQHIVTSYNKNNFLRKYLAHNYLNLLMLHEFVKNLSVQQLVTFSPGMLTMFLASFPEDSSIKEKIFDAIISLDDHRKSIFIKAYESSGSNSFLDLTEQMSTSINE